MYLSSIRVFNYKSFIASNNVDLKPGINVIVGQNNAGKTALLEAMSFDFQNVPHESLKSKPTKNVKINQPSIITFGVTTSSQELKEILNSQNALAFALPKTFDSEKLKSALENTHKIPDELLNLLNSQLENENTLVGTYESLEKKVVELFLLLDEIDQLPDQHYQTRLSENLKTPSALAYDFSNGRFNNIQFDLGGGLHKKSINSFLKEIFIFNARRIDIETSSPVEGIELKSDCSNLAGVISNLLTENRSVFHEFIDLLTSVIPSVKDIIPKRRPQSSGVGFEYVLEASAYDSNLRRSDLAKYLGDCGTGIGQVLALLFVIVTSETPRVILIDEIQSFLHPGAVKRLLEIFNTHPVKHQYILTTHSPEVLNNSHPSNIILVDIDNGISEASSISTNNTGDMEKILNSLGMRVSDYSFGHHFLWVEGETEKSILPLLLGNRSDVNILVINSGIIYKNRKDGVKIACELVKKMSAGENTRNRTVSIVFDREALNETQLKELKNIAGNLLRFLPRRMTENYLLHPLSISELFIDLGELGIDEKTIARWFDERFDEGWIDIETRINSLSKHEWLEQVHGANLLNELFSELTENRCNYNSYKRELGVQLTERILKGEPTFLVELKEFYNALLINEHF